VKREFQKLFYWRKKRCRTVLPLKVKEEEIADGNGTSIFSEFFLFISPKETIFCSAEIFTR
jgi:hypothetical protein